MKDNFLSIVIPCKNEEKQIGRTLKSLLNQTVDISKVPIYIADAGSTDSTLPIIGKFISEGRLNIKIVPGGYPPEGRNNGASYCRTEFILFLDADIELGENSSIEKSLNIALEKNLDLVATYIKCKDGNQYDKIFWEKIHAFTYKYPYIVGPYAAGMFILIRSSTFDRLGGFNEKMVLGDDWELTHKIPLSKFGVAHTYIWTTNRRFMKQGYLKTFSRYFRVAFSKDFREKGNESYMKVKF
jgi:glycosyltransferase involved in cell wall biosynthesis